MKSQWIVPAIVLASLSGAVEAALPVFAGANYDFAGGHGYDDANISATSAVSNVGHAIGEAVFHTASQPNGGRRALRWTPKTWGNLPGSPTTPSGFKISHAAAINPDGVAVGDNEVYNAAGQSLGYRALRWAADGSTTQLANLGASPAGNANTRALAVNLAGTAVGFSSKHIGSDYRGNRAVVWAAGQQSYFEVQSLPGQLGSAFLDSRAVDINDGGMIAGTSDLYDNAFYLGQRAVRWNAAGQITQLGILGTTAGGYTYVEGIGINNAGVVAGLASKYAANNADLGKRAVRYAPNTTAAVELGGLGGTTLAGYSAAQVRSISDGGLIVGASNKYLLTADIGTRAVYWNTTGSTAANELPGLGTSSGITHGLAISANRDDVIVGWAEKHVNNALVGRRAVMWTTAGAGTVTDLNTLIDDARWTLTEASGISDTGFVSGVGVFDADVGGNLPGYTRHFSMLIPKAGTYGRGDANFDTKVNFDDLLVLAQHYGQANATREINVGDFDLNGQVNFDDLLTLAQHYGQTLSLQANPSGDQFATDWALARSLAPEPASLLAGGVLLFAAPRRR